MLRQLREANPDYHSPDGHLLFARSLEDQDKIDQALQEFTALVNYYPGQEGRCRYALLLQRIVGWKTHGAFSRKSAVRSNAAPRISGGRSVNGTKSPNAPFTEPGGNCQNRAAVV